MQGVSAAVPSSFRTTISRGAGAGFCLSTTSMSAAAGAGAGAGVAAVNESSPAADLSVDTIKLYLQEEGFSALSRIRSKILGTAGVTAVGTAVWATATNRSVPRMVPALTANAAVAVTAYAVCQEGVRAVRRGHDDGWNSFWAGGLAGAALTRVAYGRGFQLLGAVLWAPLCGSLHWANSKLEAGAAVQAWLVKHDLLDLPQQQQQQQAQAQDQQQAAEEMAPPKVPVRFEDMPWREKIIAVEAVKRRELQLLHDSMKEEVQAVLAEALQERRRREQQEAATPQRRRWLLF